MSAYEKGYLAEQEFIKILNDNGIPYSYIDDWCDFIIYNTPLDVKSCMLSHKFTDKRSKKQSYKIGRFILTEEQREKELYLALFVRANKSYLFLGILKSRKNSPKYISIHKTREIGVLKINEFIREVKRNGKGMVEKENRSGKEENEHEKKEEKDNV